MNHCKIIMLLCFLGSACFAQVAKIPEQIAKYAGENNEGIFPKGEKVTNNNFTGTVWLKYLAETDTVHNVNIGSVTFEPGSRTNWHTRIREGRYFWCQTEKVCTRKKANRWW
jgi:hypothetical protein